MNDRVHAYAVKVQFSENERIAFSHIALVFVGLRHVPHDIYKPGFDFLDFQVLWGEETKTVSWSSGTGDIAGTCFEIAGSRFELELGMSDELGQLASDELVLWKRG